MNKTELTTMLDLHAAWLRGEKEGKRAVLSDAVLSDADLRRADLRRAVLSDAVLSDADLRRADLSGADLSGAVLPHRIISFGPFGTVRQMTVFDTKYDKVWSGCWTGTLAAFELKVREKFPNTEDETRQLFEAGIALCKTASKFNPAAQPEEPKA